MPVFDTDARGWKIERVAIHLWRKALVPRKQVDRVLRLLSRYTAKKGMATAPPRAVGLSQDGKFQ